MTLTVGSLCSGYAGLDLGLAQVLDTTTAWVSEVDPSACSILDARFPGVPNVGDLTTVDWKEIAHMGAHRNDTKAQSMYDRYCQGLSLAEVAGEFGISRQSVHAYFKDRGWSMRARPPARPQMTFQGRTFSLADVGYYRETSGAREYMHRVVWEHHHGPIPVDYDIHHRDHDKTNNDPANLECLPKDEHARLYNTGCNGTAHRCSREVMPSDSPAVDVLTAGYP